MFIQVDLKYGVDQAFFNLFLTIKKEDLLSKMSVQELVSFRDNLSVWSSFANYEIKARQEKNVF